MESEFLHALNHLPRGDDVGAVLGNQRAAVPHSRNRVSKRIGGWPEIAPHPAPTHDFLGHFGVEPTLRFYLSHPRPPNTLP
jgi:hypothetical protein